MEWIQTITIIGTIGSIVYYFHCDFKEWRDLMFKELSKQRDELNHHSERTDKLYEVLIDLLKNKNTP